MQANVLNTRKIFDMSELPNNVIRIINNLLHAFIRYRCRNTSNSPSGKRAPEVE